MASVKVALPPPTVPMVGSDGRVNRAWYQFFQVHLARTGGSAEDKVEVAAQGAAGAADAAVVAQDAAATANAAAVTANAAATAAGTSAGLANSTIVPGLAYPVGLTITASADGATAKIDVSSHTMVYPISPPGSVAITGATISALAYATFYNIYYDDPTYAGGAVTFHAVTDNTAFPTPTLNPQRIFLGTARTPATSVAPPLAGAGRAPYGQNTSI